MYGAFCPFKERAKPYYKKSVAGARSARLAPVILLKGSFFFHHFKKAVDGVPVHRFQYGRAVTDNYRVEEKRQTVEAGRVFADALVVIVRCVSAVRVFGTAFYVA